MRMTPPDHDRALSTAFDGQAAKFEKAPVQSNPDALRRLVEWAELDAGSKFIDAGCGPGLVASAFLEAGHSVVGVDLSGEMIARAESRCERFGQRARFRRGSVQDPAPEAPFDAAVSRLVLHHVADPLSFVDRLAGLTRPGGVVVVCDHTTDPDPGRAAWHNEIERLRDKTHTSCLSPGALVDLFAAAGLSEIRLREETFTLDFDEWFDRGTPASSKAEVRELLLAGPGARGFRVVPGDQRQIQIDCVWSVVRGLKVASRNAHGNPSTSC
jgi:SAM-dependent methyltransferase